MSRKETETCLDDANKAFRVSLTEEQISKTNIFSPSPEVGAARHYRRCLAEFREAAEDQPQLRAQSTPSDFRRGIEVTGEPFVPPPPRVDYDRVNIVLRGAELVQQNNFTPETRKIRSGDLDNLFRAFSENPDFANARGEQFAKILNGYPKGFENDISKDDIHGLSVEHFATSPSEALQEFAKSLDESPTITEQLVNSPPSKSIISPPS